MTEEKKKAKRLGELVSLKVKIEKFDKEMVERRVQEVKERVKLVDNIAYSQIWELGKVLWEATKDLSDREISYFYDRIEKELGITAQYQKNAKHFYRCFPTLPELIKHVKIPIRWFYFLSGLDWKSTNVGTLLLDSRKELSQMSFDEFKEWVKINIGLKYRKGFPAFCKICGAELNREGFRSEWDFIPVHFTCIDNLLEEIKQEQENLKKLFSLRDKLANWQNKLSKEQESYEGLIKLLQLYNSIISKYPDVEEEIKRKVAESV